jgi:hypothetical protein
MSYKIKRACMYTQTPTYSSRIWKSGGCYCAELNSSETIDSTANKMLSPDIHFTRKSLS